MDILELIIDILILNKELLVEFFGSLERENLFLDFSYFFIFGCYKVSSIFFSVYVIWVLEKMVISWFFRYFKFLFFNVLFMVEFISIWV